MARAGPTLARPRNTGAGWGTVVLSALAGLAVAALIILMPWEPTSLASTDGSGRSVSSTGSTGTEDGDAAVRDTRDDGREPASVVDGSAGPADRR